MQRKILVAVDGSTYSYNSLRYLSQLFTDLPEIYIHLLYVVPAGSLPLGMEWLSDQDRILSLPAAERRSYSSAKRFMQEAVLQLGRRGIAAEQVSTQIILSKAGVAADIISEARSGLYDALLVGRRGLTTIEELILGSVSSAIAQSCYDLPIWVVDGKVDSRKFLFPVDTSFNSLKAADHLGFILQENPYAQVSLVHLAALFGGDTAPDFAALAALWGKEWCEQHLHGVDAVFHGPEQMLLDRGLPPSQIFREPAEKSLTPHSSIVKLSGKGNYGTVVIGRRAKGLKKGFFKGVSDKVLELANHLAIWVVG
jgi:nucleotide-binding universal stress UspA family protein